MIGHETGDRRESFERLYHAHYRSVYAYARRRTDESVAQEVAAETFLAAWRRLDEAVDGGLAWLYRTAHLTLQNQLRGQRRQIRLQARMGQLPHDAVTDTATSYADRAVIAEALQNLSDSDQELIFLVYWEQLDTRTAAKVIGSNPGAAAVRLHRARRRLREVLLRSPGPHAVRQQATNSEVM